MEFLCKNRENIQPSPHFFIQIPRISLQSLKDQHTDRVTGFHGHPACEFIYNWLKTPGLYKKYKEISIDFQLVMGVAHVILHFDGIFHEINQRTIGGIPRWKPPQHTASSWGDMAYGNDIPMYSVPQRG